MKKKIRRRKCKHCDELFKPDSRNLKRQKFCRKSECKEASKRYSQQKWLMKPKNRGYFSGPTNVIRVQQWRQQNPGYWKRVKHKKILSLIKGALQDPLLVKTTIGKGFSNDLMQNALQDSLSAKTLVITGFSPHLNEMALKFLIDIVAQRDIILKKDVPKI
jgi:hypothetical protein